MALLVFLGEPGTDTGPGDPRSSFELGRSPPSPTRPPTRHTFTLLPTPLARGRIIEYMAQVHMTEAEVAKDFPPFSKRSGKAQKS